MPRLRGRDAADDREDLAVVGALLERVDDLLVGDLLALQVALHQRVGDFADLVHQLLAVLLRAARPARRGSGSRSSPRARPESWRKAFMSTRSITPSHARARSRSGSRSRPTCGPKALLELLERAEEVGALAVEHVHEQHPRDVELGRPRPQAARGDLDAHHRVDDEHGRLAHAQRAERVGDEARLAGRVEQVDLALPPLERAERRRDRHLPRLLVGVGVRHGACRRAPSPAGWSRRPRTAAPRAARSCRPRDGRRGRRCESGPPAGGLRWIACDLLLSCAMTIPPFALARQSRRARIAAVGSPPDADRRSHAAACGETQFPPVTRPLRLAVIE